MKLEVLQENLNRALSIVSRVITSRPQIPILSHVLLSVKDGIFTLTASNTETTIVVPVGAKIESEGSFTIPARTLLDLVASISPGKISLENVEGQLKIKSTGFTGKINGTAASEYPTLTATYDEKNSWDIGGSVLLQAINKTMFACATDESRAILTGVLFKPKKTGLTLAATDGFRLSKMELDDLSFGENLLNTLVLPAKTLLELSKLLSEKTEDKAGKMKIFFLDAGQVLFIVGEIKIYSRVISGNFPDFEKIIPTDSTIKVVTTAEELGKAVRLASIFARESANIVKLKLEDSKLVISANAAQVGENETDFDVDVQKGSGQELQIAFNYRYILDFLSSLGKENKITIDFTTSLAPGVFRAEGSKNFLHLIMPVRVQA